MSAERTRTAPPALVLECTTNSDCLSLGERGVCTNGWCRRTTVESIVDGSVLDCSVARALIDATLKPTVDAADRSCEVDSDCRLISLSNASYGDSCYPGSGVRKVRRRQCS